MELTYKRQNVYALADEKELNAISFLGFPLGFYMFAQGSLVVYLAIIVVYVIVMNRLGHRYGVAERR